MLFLSRSNVDVMYAELLKFLWRFYITPETLLITSQIELINKRRFVKIALDKSSKTFVVHIADLKVMSIYLSKFSQIQDLDDFILAILQ